MQGQSEYTRFKEERFTPIFTQSLLISKAQPVARYAYYHVDLNAGSGFNDKAHVAGSPINFLHAADRNDRRNFYAFFVDHNREHVAALIRRPEVEAANKRVHLFHYDNSEVLPVVAQFIADRERNPQFAMGSIVVDPNGYHEGVPWDALREFCHAFTRFDLIMNLNVRQYQMERWHIRAGCQAGWRQKSLRPISEFPAWFNRPNWMWTDICRIGGNRWIQLVGRTIRTQSVGYGSLGFYDSRSERAQRILARLEGPTVKETARTVPQLPFLYDV
jgi:three-Cys-motif partner protein